MKTQIEYIDVSEMSPKEAEATINGLREYTPESRWKFWMEVVCFSWLFS